MSPYSRVVKIQAVMGLLVLGMAKSGQAQDLRAEEGLTWSANSAAAYDMEASFDIGTAATYGDPVYQAWNFDSGILVPENTRPADLIGVSVDAAANNLQNFVTDESQLFAEEKSYIEITNTTDKPLEATLILNNMPVKVTIPAGQTVSFPSPPYSLPDNRPNNWPDNR